MSASMPWLSRFSTCEACLIGSSLAHCTSSLTPSSSARACIEATSKRQRGWVWVRMATPMVMVLAASCSAATGAAVTPAATSADRPMRPPTNRLKMLIGSVPPLDLAVVRSKTRRSVAGLGRLDRLPGPDLRRQRRIARDPRLRPLHVEHAALRRAAAPQQRWRQMVALDELLRDVAPADRQMEDAARRPALVARAAVPDAAVDHRDRPGGAGDLDLLRVRRV